MQFIGYVHYVLRNIVFSLLLFTMKSNTSSIGSGSWVHCTGKIAALH